MNDVADSLHFSDAYAVVAQQLGKARQQVVCGLDGPCARPLFDLLLACSRKGVLLTLVVPGEIQDEAPGIAWERLTALGAQLYVLRPGAPRLQTSVCVIDAALVMNGALARLQALSDAQSVGVLLQADSALAEDCAQGISQWAVTHALTQHPASPQDTSPPAPCAGSALAEFDDPLRWAPAWQTDLLQAHALALQADLAEMHRTINAFDQAQDAAIGPLLRECLDAKRKHLQQMHAQSGTEEARAQADEAQDNFDRYTQAQHAKPAPAPALDPAAQAQMKQLYRKLAMRLHPDRVEEDEKSEAQALFQRLQAGYENNDLATLQALEQQVLLVPQERPTANGATQPSVGSRSPAQQAMALRARLAQHQRDREGLLRSATWQTLSTQSNWSVWFTQQASYLQAELQRYSQALAATRTP
ncbi:MAG: J domain-containing protein [Rhodoferax sp.]|nr:J domain-containing protein [Rhodoferax sp.]